MIYKQKIILYNYLKNIEIIKKIILIKEFNNKIFYELYK